LTFILQKRSLNWQIAKINPQESCLCSTCKYVCPQSGFKNIPNNVDLYNDVRNCLLNLPKTLTFEWKFLFNTTYTFELIIRFKLFKLYSNMLKCVNLIEIWFYAYLYVSSFLVLWHIIWDHCADTGSWIRGQIQTFAFAPSGNNQHWLLAIIGHAKTNILQQNMW
jgi:hypothetical protein